MLALKISKDATVKMTVHQLINGCKLKLGKFSFNTNFLEEKEMTLNNLAQHILEKVNTPTILFRISGFSGSMLQIVDSVISRNELENELRKFNPSEYQLRQLELAFGNGKTKEVKYTVRFD